MGRENPSRQSEDPHGEILRRLGNNERLVLQVLQPLGLRTVKEISKDIEKILNPDGKKEGDKGFKSIDQSTCGLAARNLVELRLADRGIVVTEVPHRDKPYQDERPAYRLSGDGVTVKLRMIQEASEGRRLGPGLHPVL